MFDEEKNECIHVHGVWGRCVWWGKAVAKIEANW